MRKIIRSEIIRPADDANYMVYKTYNVPAAVAMRHVTTGEGYIYDIIDMLYSAIEDT